MTHLGAFIMAVALVVTAAFGADEGRWEVAMLDEKRTLYFDKQVPVDRTQPIRKLWTRDLYRPGGLDKDGQPVGATRMLYYANCANQTLAIAYMAYYKTDDDPRPFWESGTALEPQDKEFLTPRPRTWGEAIVEKMCSTEPSQGPRK